MSSSAVTVIGAGPYGLSIAAHLRAKGVSLQVFGNPMQVWRERMPDGMWLKSDGFASNLSDPAEVFPLRRFCEIQGIPYDDTLVPVSIETFRAYGVAFQKRLVPELQDKQITRITRDRSGFQLEAEDGSVTHTQKVVLAIGISHFQFVPPVLAGLPAEFSTHSSAHRNGQAFRGRNVTVVGGGSSAVDLAVLLAEGGASVTLVARRKALRFLDPPKAEGRSTWDSLMSPASPIGPGWRSRLYSDLPNVFYRLPQQMRHRIVTGHNGPAASWPMKGRFDKVTALLGQTVQRASVVNGSVQLELAGDGGTTIHTTDHVIAATGYRVDLKRLAFLSDEIRANLRAVESTPLLSPHFESSVSGLYFVGAASANCFGPMMRFACGAEWTAKRITKRLVESKARRTAPAIAEAIAR